MPAKKDYLFFLLGTILLTLTLYYLAKFDFITSLVIGSGAAFSSTIVPKIKWRKER